MVNKDGIHQWLPGFTRGDAISNYALAMQKILKNWGYDSFIFCPEKYVSPEMQGLCKDWSLYSNYSNSRNIVLYHFSVGSLLSNGFKTIPDKKVLIYHNITPEKYFRTINIDKALVLRQGRKELKELSKVPRLSLADSEYNRIELKENGYSNTGVLYPIINLNTLKDNPNKNIIKSYKDNWTNILFVGRLVPNKKIEDVIKCFFYYKNTVNSKSRLFIVGSFVGMERYYAYLRALLLELNLNDVIFTGHIQHDELIAYYKLADVFLCMSEHEGFCIPLVESMFLKVPIIAYKAAAVSHTLNGSGILVDNKRYPEIAELIEVVTKNNGVKKDILRKQTDRLNDFSLSAIEKQLKKYLKELLRI